MDVLLLICAVQLRLSGFEFVSCGEAKNKKEAQGLAAKQFLEHLVEQGRVPQDALAAAAVSMPSI